MRSPETPVLTPKQQRFVEEYLIDLNATQAAIRAGYSPKTARAIGAENLTKPDIQTAIAQVRAELSARTRVTAERVVRELARIAFAQITDAVSWNNRDLILHDSGTLDDDTAAAIQDVTIRYDKNGTPMFKKIQMQSKTQALHLLGRYLGVWKEGCREQPPQPYANWLGDWLDAFQGSALNAQTKGATTGWDEIGRED